MTGPLAQQIAHVRHVIAYLAEQSQHAEIDGTLPQDEAFAALSVIERHVQKLTWRAESAEAEVRRLTEGLREISKRTASPSPVRATENSPKTSDKWFIPEGDRTCGVIHKNARATCIKRRGHEGSHANTQGTWTDGPWCEYPPSASPSDGGGA